jgi:hypothetical protein
MAAAGSGAAAGRPSQRQWVQARRIRRPRVMTARASASQNSTTSQQRSVQQQSLPYWLARVSALDHPTAPAWTGAGSPRVAIWPAMPVRQHRPAGLVVVAGVQVHRGPLGQRADHGDGAQGGSQQPIVAAVGRGRHRRQRDATRLGSHRALEPLLAAVDRAGSGDLATAGRFGDAAVHAQVLHLQAEQSVGGGQYGPGAAARRPSGDPFVAAAAQRGSRAGGG